MTVAIIPAAGSGSSLGLPFPKELYSVEPGKLLIDYTLLQLKDAEITEAFIVTTDAKLKQLAGVLGNQRRGVDLRYVTVKPSDSVSWLGTVLRGAKRANAAYGRMDFLAVSPDLWYSEPGIVSDFLTWNEPNSFLYSRDAGEYEIVRFDAAAANHLRNLVMQTRANGTEDQHSFQSIRKLDESKGNVWTAIEDLTVTIKDLGDWSRIHSHISTAGLVPHED